MTATLATGAALRVAGLGKDFGGVRALAGVSLEAQPGERHVVIGPNGAGKSTLFRIVSGEHAPTSGSVTLDGRPAHGLRPEVIARRGVARSFQTSSLFSDLTVLENVMLALAAADGTGFRALVPLERVGDTKARAQEALARLGLEERQERPASALSHGEKRQLEIAMALAQRPRLLLLDEPLAGLSALERERVAATLHDLPRTATVLLIEHDLGFALRFADRLTCLAGGALLAAGTPDEIRAHPEVQRVYVGTALEQPARPDGPTGTQTDTPPGARPAPRPAALEVRDLEAGYGAARVLEGVTLNLRHGECVAVLGRNGMGKTTLLSTLMGFRRPTGGQVTLGGRDATGATAQTLAQRGLALVPQGRRMLAGLTVREELELAFDASRARRASTPWRPERAYDLFPRLHERRSSLSTTLSGGEQQMVAIARALLRNPDVLLMDEPSEGLSPLVVGLVRDAIREVRQGGQPILLAEQNLELALAVADRVYILEHGQIVFEGTPGALLENEALVTASLGVH